MELEEFIKTTLLNIKKGIREANSKIAKENGLELGKDQNAQQYQINGHGMSKGIKFDIALIVTKEKGADGGGKIRVAVLDIGGKKTSASKEEHVSRISFDVDAFQDIN